MLKGHATIELTDVNTGKKQVIEHDNMVTNALAKLYGNNAFASNLYGLRDLGWGTMNGTSIGGILLFDENIEENPEIIYKPRGVNCVGYASNDVYSSANNLRGSRNSSETEVLDNGFKYVWDFATNQANGIIKSLSLTSVNGGKIGYGSENSAETNYPFIRMSYAVTKWNLNATNTFRQTNIKMFKGLDGKDYIAALYGISVDTVRIDIYKFTINEISLTNAINTKKLIASYDLEIGTYTSNTSTSYYYYWASCVTDSKDKLYWAYCNAYIDGSASGGKVSIIEIPIDNYENFTRHDLITTETASSTFCKVVIDEESRKAYIAKGSVRIYKADLETGVVEKVITSNQSWNEKYPLLSLNGMKIFGNTVLDENDNILYQGNAEANSSPYTFYYSVTYGASLDDMYYRDVDSGSIDIKQCIYTPYLATINNLDTPVTKTASQTMKITYVLTDTEA